MKHIKSIHVIGVLCLADLIFASQGFFTVLMLAGYGVYRLEKCPDCPECPEKEPEPLNQHPIPREPVDQVPLDIDTAKFNVLAKLPEGYTA